MASVYKETCKEGMLGGWRRENLRSLRNAQPGSGMRVGEPRSGTSTWPWGAHGQGLALLICWVSTHHTITGSHPTVSSWHLPSGDNGRGCGTAMEPVSRICICHTASDGISQTRQQMCQDRVGERLSMAVLSQNTSNSSRRTGDLCSLCPGVQE